MAKTYRIWGIDIGQCALKALHCVRVDDQLVADAYDYIEYPKILSQPEADPEALLSDAIAQFLSRNQISREDRVAISVPGQSGLSKFFKPPPVDVKKIPDIVRYEAKQQIPFPLEDVIWDFQQMAGGTVVDGFAVDAEVGLFAMKRDQVYRYLQPFQRSEIELDIVQLSPLCLYNFAAYDLLTDGPDPDEFDPDDPPESIVVLSMGTDATDLVVTNGFRVWQRSIPLGGNHFTKQLCKELKLTFAKAEHLKRNARQAEDPKRVFQAMRPVFKDMVTEIQRSIGYFQSIDRRAKIRAVVLLGNTVKLPGLREFVAKNLGFPLLDFKGFERLDGKSVLSAPAFHDNILTFPVCYGLCLQGADLARLSTNLLPREIMTQRLIRAKKPWAVASAGALMLACAFNFFFNYTVWSRVREDREIDGVTWAAAEQAVDAVQSKSSGYTSEFSSREAELTFLEGLGEEVVGAADRRLLWLELLKAVNSALPWTEGVQPGTYVDFKTLPLDQRKELHLEYVESEYFPDLATWWSQQKVQERYFELQRHLEALRGPKEPEPAFPPATTPDAGGVLLGAGGDEEEMGIGAIGEDAGLAAGTEDPSALNLPGPQGPGWVIEIKGYHYYNSDRRTGGATHVRNTLLRNLEDGSVDLPVDNTGRLVRFSLKELGIAYPILAMDEGQPRKVKVPNPEYVGRPGATGYAGGMYEGYEGGEEEEMGGYGGYGPGMLGGPGGLRMTPGMGPTAGKKKEGEEETEEEEQPPFFEVPKYSFLVQFCWQERPLSERLKLREERRKQLEAAKQAAEAAAAEGGPEGETVSEPAPDTPAAPAAPAPAAPAPAAPGPATAPAVPPTTAPGTPAAGPTGATPTGPAPPAPTGGNPDANQGS